MRNNKLFNNDNYNWNIDDMKKQKIYPLLSTLNVPSFVKDFRRICHYLRRKTLFLLHKNLIRARKHAS